MTRPQRKALMIAGDTYILQGNRSYDYNTLMKVLVIEVTNETILFQNLDVDSKPKFRMTKENLDYHYKILETMPKEILEGKCSTKNKGK
jgi:hypothetical protein